MRYAFVARERTRYPVRMLCRLLAVSVSGFHGSLHRQRRPDPDLAVRADLRSIHASSRGTYGRPRLVHALRARAHAVGPKRVARLMREEGLAGKVKGRFKPRTTDSRHRRPLVENRLDRRFAVDSPVPAWVGDITYLPTREGWLYLATVIDLRTRFGNSNQSTVVRAHSRRWCRLRERWSASPVAPKHVRLRPWQSGIPPVGGFRKDTDRTWLRAEHELARADGWDNAVAEIARQAHTFVDGLVRQVRSIAADHAAIASYMTASLGNEPVCTPLSDIGRQTTTPPL
ncbi:MAG: IS3 family transposase [Lysobacterales bacterium]